jgi:hypothetical protein
VHLIFLLMENTAAMDDARSCTADDALVTERYDAWLDTQCASEVASLALMAAGDNNYDSKSVEPQGIGETAVGRSPSARSAWRTCVAVDCDSCHVDKSLHAGNSMSMAPITHPELQTKTCKPQVDGGCGQTLPMSMFEKTSTTAYRNWCNTCWRKRRSSSAKRAQASLDRVNVKLPDACTQCGRGTTDGAIFKWRSDSVKVRAMK